MTTLKDISVTDTRYVKVLDKGFVGLIDHMGSDDAVVQAARVSYGTGTKKVREDRGLIRYLMRHEHTTPFEMCEVKFHIRLPIFVMRQLIRHRTASVNEYSGRYSVMTDEFYVPKTIELQSTTNKQGREGLYSEEETTTDLNSQYSEEEASINDFHKDSEETNLADSLGNFHGKGLGDLLSVNQRFMFTIELFKGDKDSFEKALNTIDSAPDVKAAINFLDSESITRKWNKESNEVIEFYQLVQKRYKLPE